MKKIIALFSILVLMLVTITTQAQTTTPEKVGDPTSYMTPEQLAKYHSDMEVAALQKKLETYGNWVGVGGEVGEAVRSGLEAVVDVADQFGQTDVGKFTLVLVAWKVMGKDTIRILLGFIFIALVTWIFMRVYRNTYHTKRVLTERIPNGWFRRATKKYSLIEPDMEWEGVNGVKILMLFMYMGAIGISYAIMFG